MKTHRHEATHVFVSHAVESEVPPVHDVGREKAQVDRIAIDFYSVMSDEQHQV